MLYYIALLLKQNCDADVHTNTNAVCREFLAYYNWHTTHIAQYRAVVPHQTRLLSIFLVGACRCVVVWCLGAL